MTLKLTKETLVALSTEEASEVDAGARTRHNCCDKKSYRFYCPSKKCHKQSRDCHSRYGCNNNSRYCGGGGGGHNNGSRYCNHGDNHTRKCW